MKAVAIFSVSSIFVMTALAWPQASSAQVLIFQTTFDDTNCPTRRAPGEHWRQSDYFAQAPGVEPCAAGDGIRPWGAWTANGFEDRIIAEANNPNGGGGKGFRHYRGDGSNSNGGGLSIGWAAGVPELWGRFYMRYQLGFAWSLSGQPIYTKDMYMNVGSPSAWVFGVQGGGGRWGIFNGKTGIPSSLSWSATMGGAVGDGLWHCYEFHIQHGAGARIEIWVDNVQVLNTTTDMPPGSTDYFALGENQASPTGAGATPWYTDYDDLAFSTSGRIGCTYGTPGSPPAGLPAPQNLRVQ